MERVVPRRWREVTKYCKALPRPYNVWVIAWNVRGKFVPPSPSRSRENKNPLLWDSRGLSLLQFTALHAAEYDVVRWGLPTMKKDPLSKELLRLKKKTSWSWERMCREMHRVMGEEGPSHTTLFRYASGRVKRPKVVTERYVQQASQKLAVELAQK